MAHLVIGALLLAEELQHGQHPPVLAAPTARCGMAHARGGLQVVGGSDYVVLYVQQRRDGS